MRLRQLIAGIACIALAWHVPTLDAGVIVFTDKTAFLAATSSTTSFDFTGIAPPGGFANFDTQDGLTVDSVNFTGFELGCLVGRCAPLYALAVTNQSGPDFGVPAVLVGPHDVSVGSDRDI